MRTKLNLDLRDLNRYAMLVVGDPAVGKTHFCGDFLRWGMQNGHKVHFINFSGQDGYLPLANMGLGEVGETVESLKDFGEALTDVRKNEIKYLACDGLHDLLRFTLVEQLGSLRYPDPKVDGERAKMLWGQIKWAVYQGVIQSKNAAPFVIWTAPKDYSAGDDPSDTTSRYETPELVGKTNLSAVSWFDFVGYMKSQVLGKDRIRRTLDIQPTDKRKARQRLPTQINDPIDIPNGQGGWENFYRAVERAMGVEEKGK